MANWITNVDLYDLHEAFPEYPSVDDVQGYLSEAAARIRPAVTEAGLMDDEMEEILADMEDPYLETVEDVDNVLYMLWNWGDDGERMWLNTAFPARADA